MSPDGTKEIGDLHELPACADSWLVSLLEASEGIIRRQIDLLGKGDPDSAPDPREVFRNEQLIRENDEALMLDRLDDLESNINEVKSQYHTEDDGIPIRVSGIGAVVKDAYTAIDTSVGELNAVIDNAEESKTTFWDDENKVDVEILPRWYEEKLVSQVWTTLTEVYEAVDGVSNDAARQALGIEIGERTYNDSPYGSPPPSYPTASYTGGDQGNPVVQTSGSMGTAIIPSGDKPDAMAMMNYLIKEHGFTPAQAAGIVANAKFESGFDVSATGDNGTAHGLFQWRFDRYAGLQEFASGSGKDIGKWETHIDYMVHELRSGSGYQQAENIVDGNPNDARAVAEGFDRHYERSSGHTINDRRDYAAGLISEWNKQNSNLVV